MEVIASTTNGRVRGGVNRGVAEFKGIPYGAPTGGKNRFMPPNQPDSWDGIRDALEYGPSCPQPVGPVLNVSPKIVEELSSGEPLPQSEDCLVLNVWTPSTEDRAKRPVLFWCHGGGFFIGSGSEPWYDGSSLACRGDVVVVTVNHRLGPLGFLHLGDIAGERYTSSGIVGMLDLVLALEWVRDNILSFGGDPGNVTIFGESGGGAKVSTLMAMPYAHSLFHKAIVQSGPGVRMHSRRRATRNAKKIISKMKHGLSEIDTLQDVPAQVLIDAQTAAAKINPFFMLEPVVDGEILPHPPFDPVAPQISESIPLLIGTTKDEATLFIGNIPIVGTFSKDNFLAPVINSLLLRLLIGKSSTLILNTYRQNRPDHSPRELFSDILTDWVMRIGTIRMAERKTAGGSGPVYMYRFDWESGAFDGRLKSHHALEIPFVFDNLALASQMISDRPEAQVLAEAMSESWISFARCGNPNHEGIPFWPVYSVEDRSTMLFNKECQVENDPDGEERKVWEGVKLRWM